MFIKEPAFIFGEKDDGTSLRVRWTNDRYEHNMKVWNDDRTEVLYSVYLPAIIMHELGHSAGLDELRDLPAEDYGHYVMHQSVETFKNLITSVPNAEALWLHHNQRSKQRVVKSGKYKGRVVG